LELVLADAKAIKFICSNSKVQVQGCTFNHAGWTFDVSSILELQQAVDYVAQQMVGDQWCQSPVAARLSESIPATNLATISRLIGTSAIEAVFDPYLENRSLSTLIDILPFGQGSIANGVRVLSTEKTTSGQVPRLTINGFSTWLGQLGITGEIRTMGASEHRRFMLLNSGQSLLLGPSLNSIQKNEAIRLEPNTEDKSFFDRIWQQASPLR
jgi:hypothetical protein